MSRVFSQNGSIRRAQAYLARKLLIAGVLLATSPLAAADDHAALLDRIDAIRRTHGIAAAAVVLVDGDGVLAQRSVGVTDWDSATPVDADTRYKVGSVSKVFTALAIQIAARQGIVALDQPLQQTLANPPWQNRWRATRPLTLAMLLEHSAGWFDMGRAEFDSADPSPLTFAQALALNPASRISQWPPGMHASYSNTGPGVAGYVLEQASGVSFEAFTQRHVFAPLQLHSASFLRDAATRQHLAQGYDSDGRTPIPYWHIAYRPAGGLNITAADMGRFVRFMLNRGSLDGVRVLDPAPIERMEQPRTTLAARHGLRLGYGLGIEASAHHGHVLYTHGGDGDGYLSRFGYSRESGRGYFVVITAFNRRAHAAITTALADWLVAPLPPVAAAPERVLPLKTMQALTGEYQLASTRFARPDWQQQTLRIVLREGRLHTQRPGESARVLIALGDDLFRREDEAIASTVLALDADGSAVLQGPMGNWQRRAVRDN
jgi:CubicO group peptidase (beta-lactamase class C family)